MDHKSKSPCARASAERASKSKQHNHSSKPRAEKSTPPLHVSVFIKQLIVHLGARGYMPKRLCKSLINSLGLREV
jgi:hypothetical protein